MSGRGALGAPSRVVVVGGGVLGTMHAFMASARGFEVVQIERELAPRSASVRNFGLIWVGGRAPGAELELAWRARELWAQLADEVRALSVRRSGSITIALDGTELQLMKEACARDDAARRGWELLDRAGVREVNPELSEAAIGGLLCKADAIVEPRVLLGALREALERNPRYRWLPGRTAVELEPWSVRDDSGDRHFADRVFVCTGAHLSGLLAPYLGDAPLRRVRLQMMQTGPYPGVLTTALADGDSMRYYPAFDLPARAALVAQAPVAAAGRAQLLLVQRPDGSLTIGDTHDYEEPFAFDLDEAVYEHLLARAATVLRRPLPPVRRRWAGVYCELSPGASGSALYWRQEILPGVEVVSGLGGRGMTCSPAVAEESFAESRT